MLLTKKVPFTFCPTKRERERVRANNEEKDFVLMNVLLASKNLKIIRTYEKTLINIISSFSE